MRVYLSALLISALAVAGSTAAKPVVSAQTPATPMAAPPTRAMLIERLNGSFKSVDANGDGVLSQAELTAAEVQEQKNRLAAARSRMEAAFDKLDSNHDGTLTKSEFLAAAPQASSNSPDGAALLTQLDRNKDSKLSIDEYSAPILSRFDRLDINHDGALSPAERQAHLPAKS